MPLYIAVSEVDNSSADVTASTLNMTSSGSSRLAIIVLHINSAKAGLAITVDGVAATLLGNANNAYIYYFVAPPVASVAYTATWTTAARAVMRVIQVTGANQVTPLRAITASSGTTTQPTITPTTGTNELVIDVLNILFDEVATVGGGQAQISQANYAGLGRRCCESWEAAGAASTVMDWTLATSRGWDNATVVVLPTDSGGPVWWV